MYDSSYCGDKKINELKEKEEDEIIAVNIDEEARKLIEYAEEDKKSYIETYAYNLSDEIGSMIEERAKEILGIED